MHWERELKKVEAFRAGEAAQWSATAGGFPSSALMYHIHFSDQFKIPEAWELWTITTPNWGNISQHSVLSCSFAFFFYNHNNNLHFCDLWNITQQAKIISVITVQAEEVQEGEKHCRCWDTARSKEGKAAWQAWPPLSTKEIRTWSRWRLLSLGIHKSWAQSQLNLWSVKE